MYRLLFALSILFFYQGGSHGSVYRYALAALTSA